MAIVRMKKLTIIGVDQDRDTVMESLMRLGAVEINDTNTFSGDESLSKYMDYAGDDAAVSKLESEIALIRSAIDRLCRYDKAKKLFAIKRTYDYELLRKFELREKEIINVADKITGFEKQISSLNSEKNRLESEITSLIPWESADIPMEINSTRYSAIVWGTLPVSVDVHDLESLLYEEVPESCLQSVGSVKDQHYIIIIYLKESEQKVRPILKQFGFNLISFKDLEGTPKHNILSAQDRLKAMAEEQKLTESQISALAGQREELEAFCDYLLMKKDQAKALERIVRTDRTFILSGWVPAESCIDLEKTVRSQAGCYMDFQEPGKDEEFPVLLQNNTFVKPFELVTELYSLPKSGEVDPNFFMAPFYFIFFGMMVSDAGYGLVMALLAGLALIKLKPRGMAEKLIKLIFLGGISTFFWGVLFGGWFGNLADIISGKTNAIPPLWFNPLNDPMKLLFVSFILGGIHIFVGMGLKGYLLIKQGKPLAALFDVGFWYILLIGLVMLAGKGAVFTAGKYMAIGGAVLLVLTQGRDRKNPVARLVSGILSLYSVTGYMSDILSYSRLLALGLATGVIATVINSMGSLFGFTPIGIVLMFVILIIGTVFNIAINALGAYVHASRLQYVEFFGKFYEGGGKAFQPFKIVTKYINLTDGRKD